MPAPQDSRRSFLKVAAGVAGGAALSDSAVGPAASAAGEPLICYVGTFSSPLGDVPPTQVDLPPGNGRGIHLFHADTATGDLKPIGVQRMGTSPSCLALNAAGTRLYSANETDNVGPGREGSVGAFSIDRSTGNLSPLNTVRSGAAGPTYIALHPGGKHLLVANYFGGAVAVLPVRADGRLDEPSDVQSPTGPLSPARAKHAPPGSFAISGHDRTHAHQIVTDPSGRFVLHVDLGLDRIYIWRFDTAGGKLAPAGTPYVSLPPGDGPRHVHFHPNGKWLYSIQEEGSTLVLFDWDGGTGTLSERQTLSTLPSGYAGSNFCSEILVSHDGRFVYAGNRLHDSIGIFAVGRDGRLTHVADEWTRGDYPRSFTFSPDGSFLYCCNQRADHVAVFRVNRRSGMLKFTGHYAAVGNPSHIVFLGLGSNA
jgi:6-phosphogluconolactonase (cycloisomerase 2 family)